MECTICGRNDIVTDEGDVPRCSRHVLTQRKYQVEVLVEVTLDGDSEAAYTHVDGLMQRLWDGDHAGSKPGVGWHFEMLEGCVGDVTGDG